MAKPDSDPCPACGTVNSIYVSRCRNCGEALPWAKPQAAAPPVVPTAPVTPGQAPPIPTSGPSFPPGGPMQPLPPQKVGLNSEVKLPSSIQRVIYKTLGAIATLLGAVGILGGIYNLMNGQFKLSGGAAFFIVLGIWLWNKGDEV